MCRKDGAYFHQNGQERPLEADTWKGNLNNEDANLGSQCKGTEAEWGWCIGGTARMSVWLER